MILEGFDVELAGVFAEMCEDAYAADMIDDMRPWLGRGYDGLYYFEMKNHEGWLFTSEEMNVLLFVGSNDFQDWLTNLDAHMIESWDAKLAGGIGYVHHGFQQALDEVRPQITDLLSGTQAFNGAPLFIIGHSLGGAMAALAALSLARHAEFAPTAVYTFGSPRPGDKDLSRTLKNNIPRHFRIEVAGDAVPHIPPWFTGYRHCGDLVYIDSRGRLRRRPTWYARLLAAWRARGKKIQGHHIASYVAGLKEAANVRIKP